MKLFNIKYNIKFIYEINVVFRHQWLIFAVILFHKLLNHVLINRCPLIALSSVFFVVVVFLFWFWFCISYCFS
jgi:hypothetical protein